VSTRAGLYGPEAILQTDGTPARLVDALVFDVGGVTPSVLYTDQNRSSTLAQPIQTDVNGNLSFYAEPGVHSLTIRGASVAIQVPVNPVDDLSLYPLVFSVPGVQAVIAGSARLYLFEACTLAGAVLVSAGVAPTGQPIIVDVNYNGVTVYPTQGNRPQVAAGTNFGSGGAAGVTTFAAGGRLQVDVDQVGSGVPGSDLVVVVPLQRAG